MTFSPIHQFGLNPRRILVVAACVLVAVAGAITTADAGRISGFVRDANTALPLEAIDLDLFDSDFDLILGMDATTNVDGYYEFDGLTAGEYYLRADPSLSDGFVDEFHPGVFLKAEATPITVTETGTENIDFSLEPGGTISGWVTDAGNGAPLPDIDLDVYAWDRSFISSTSARTDSDGFYRVGCYPPGSFYVHADPPDTSWFVPMYYDAKRSLSTADPVTVSGTEDVGNVDFSLSLGGKVTGTIRSQHDGSPIPLVDMDVYTEEGDFIGLVHDNADSLGFYTVGPLSAGSYYVRADPMPYRYFVDTYYGDVFDRDAATLVQVGVQQTTPSIDINLPRGGTVSGTVISGVTDLPVSDVHLTFFDIDRSVLVGAGGNTEEDGTFLVGALPTGSYYLRCNGVEDLELAYEFYPNAVVPAYATLIDVVAGSETPYVNFRLEQGGWIEGTVWAEDTGQPLDLVDMDLYHWGGDFIGILPAVTDASGGFRIGPVPFSRFVLRADPTDLYSYGIQYYDHVETFTEATLIQVNPGETMQAVDFDLLYQDPTDVEEQLPLIGTQSLRIAPNPMGAESTIGFRLEDPASVTVSIHETTGRRVRRLCDRTLTKGDHYLEWDGLDAGGAPLAQGVYFVRVQIDGQSAWRKVILLR
ncbi:MAG: T9SS type A sorting domain-containing protein [Candidatus Eisenbacteria bacterium]|nr:T9SS type A sorting domain-containing protein [Candidatus Latescibacterota bacterium]MBD3300968.1 T9SS type A sorting domain-containing protein [Candidatus Eisenbacteria bacterium]